MIGCLARLVPAGLSERDARVMVSESFNRADDATSMGRCDTGQTWLPQIGIWGVVGNKGYSVSRAAGDITVIPVPFADGIVRFDVTWIAGEEPLVLARYNGGCDFIQLGINAAGNVTLYKAVACAFTSLGSYALAAVSGSTHPIALEMIGAKLRVFVDGARRFEVSVVEHMSNRYIGFRLGNSAPSSRYDNVRFERW